MFLYWHYVSNTTLLRAPWSVVKVIDTRCFYIWVFQTYLVQFFAYMMFFLCKMERISFRAPYGSHAFILKCCPCNIYILFIIGEGKLGVWIWHTNHYMKKCVLWKLLFSMTQLPINANSSTSHHHLHVPIYICLGHPLSTNVWDRMPQNM